MITYSLSDISNRIKALLPSRWFGESTPVLDSVLSSLAAAWVDLFSFLSYTQLQTRIASASDVWLDIIAQDYFDRRIVRRQLETDDSFRSRIKKGIFRDRCTRAAVLSIIKDITGSEPVIFEPTNPQDTGCYGSMSIRELAVSSYGALGGWGSLAMPFQVFVSAYRPQPMGIALVNGYGESSGGFGEGVSSYIDPNANASVASDAEIYDSASAVAPVGTIIWMALVA